MALPRALGATLLPRCAGLIQQSGVASANVLSPLATASLCRRFAADAAEAGDDTITVEVVALSQNRLSFKRSRWLKCLL
jgi:hypothetical protein